MRKQPIFAQPNLNSRSVMASAPRDRVEELVNFDVIDDHLRRVGVVVITKTVALEEYAPSGDEFYPVVYRYRPGTYFTAYVHATRDGQTYGRLQDTRWFETRFDRDLWVKNTVEERRKAALKKWSR